MTGQPERGLGLPAAIIIAGLIVSASILFAASPYGLVGAKTVTITETSTSTEESGSATLHKVVFNETGIHCSWSGEPSYISRWYVTLGNVTIVQPSNATLPFPGPDASIYGEYGMISKIVFTVPDGSYQYHGSLGLNGTVDVNGSDVVIPVYSYPTC